MAMTLGAGCQFYFDTGGGGGGTPDAGVYPDAGGCYDQPPVYEPGLELRDPYTGQCETFGVYYDYCAPGPVPPAPAPPPWGMCVSECTAFDQDEAGCQATPGCRAAYVENIDFDAGERTFFGCWATGLDWAPADLPCDALDAWDCSMRDDCSALHVGQCYTDRTGQFDCDYGPFLSCLAETGAGGGCTDDSQCGVGYRCDIPVDCDVQIPECASDPSLGCTDCGGTCVPVDGTCYGEVFCDSIPPACPPDMVATVADGCWTGACKLVEECEPAPVVCSDLGSEDECLAYDGCVPYYEGVDCTCNDGGCTCGKWVFTRCDAQ